MTMCATERARVFALCVRCTIFGYVRSKMLSSVVPHTVCAKRFCAQCADSIGGWENMCIFCVEEFSICVCSSLRFTSLFHSFSRQSEQIYISWALIFFSVRSLCAQFRMVFCRKFSHSRALSFQRRFTPNKIVQVASKVCFFVQIYIFFTQRTIE